MSDMCYVASDGRPGFYAVIAINQHHAKDVVATVTKWIKDGADVQRVTIEEAHAGLSLWVCRQEQMGLV